MISKMLNEAINEVLPDLKLEDLNLDDTFANNSIDSLDTMSIFL